MERDLKEVTPFPPLGPAVKVLMVWPRFPASYWSLGELTEIVPERSLVPPLGLITVAALCPKQWAIRLADLAFDELSDEDLLWADLVMVSAMQVQRDDVRRTLQHASKLGRRTMIGGPYASSEPEALLPLADHVVVGEPDEVFQGSPRISRSDQPAGCIVLRKSPMSIAPRYRVSTCWHWRSTVSWRCNFREAARSPASSATSSPSMDAARGRSPQRN